MMGREVEGIRDKEQGTRGGPELPPEQRRVWESDVADAIHAAERLPNGISTQVSSTWGASPWSEPGTVRHTWELVKERYGHDPEALRAFMDWAGKTEIKPGLTVSGWLDGQPAKLTLKKRAIPQLPPVPVVLPAPVPALVVRSLANVGDDVAALAVPLVKAQDELRLATTVRQNLIDDAAAKLMDFQAGRLSQAEWARYAGAQNTLLVAATARNAAAQAALDAVLESGLAKVELPAAQRGAVRYRGGLKKTPVHAAARRGAEIVERFVHRDLLPEVGIKGYTGRCKCEWNSTLRIGSKTDPSVAAHEITHAIEFQNPQVLAASNAFLAKRAGGQPTKSLRALTGTRGYRAHERAWEDDWKARGGHPYSGKDYKGLATELLTMGIERLYANPIEFAANDREYFDFVVGTLQKL